MMAQETGRTTGYDYPNWADPSAVALYLERNLPRMVWIVDDSCMFLIELRGSYSCDDGKIESHISIHPGKFFVWTTVRIGRFGRIGIWPSSSEFDGPPIRLINYIWPASMPVTGHGFGTNVPLPYSREQNTGTSEYEPPPTNT